MKIRIPGIPPARLAKGAVQSALAAVIVLGATRAAGAAECVEQANSQAAPDARWSYRVDPVSHRKCWYLQQQPPSTGSATRGSRTAADAATSLPSFVASLFSSRPGAASNVPQQDAATSPPGAEAGAAKKSSPKRPGRPAQADQIKLKRGEPQYLDPARRDALFQEFLRWSAWQEQASGSAGQ